MEIKTLAKANILQEKIEEQQKILDALKRPETSLDIWINSPEEGERSIYSFIPMDIKVEIIQVAKSAIEIELKRLETQFSDL